MSIRKGNEPEDAKSTILDFIGDLKDNIFDSEEEQGDLMLAEFFFKRMHPERVIDHIVRHILPYKAKIKKRDVNFFLENRKIFAGLPEDRIDYYSEIIATGDRLSDEDRKAIWDYFDAFVSLAEYYRKVK